MDKDKKKELQQKQGMALTENDINYLASLLYDKFTCELNSVQVCRCVGLTDVAAVVDSRNTLPVRCCSGHRCSDAWLKSPMRILPMTYM